MTFNKDELIRFYADAPKDCTLEGIDLERIPSHISIIMDGNGRWAKARGLERPQGHVAGVESLRETVTSCVRLGVDVLSVYAFSTENWNRPQQEVDLLMQLFAKTLLNELPLFHQENVRLRFFGDLDALPAKTREVFEQGLNETKDHDGMVFALAVNYGARTELVRAAKRLAQRAVDNTLDVNAINEDMFAEELYTAGLKDPDLLIRTSGELRLSNYLLWQLAYTEFYVTDIYWPDFSRYELLRAISSYQARDRRFGGVSS